MRLQQDDSSGGKIFAIAAVVLVCVAILAAVYSIVRSTDRPQAPKAGEDPFTFLCDRCGAVFTQTLKELPPEFQERYRQQELGAVDCPKCGAKASAYIPYTCPNCKKYYLTEACRDPSAPPPADPADSRCPHCGTVPYEWYLKHRPKP